MSLLAVTAVLGDFMTDISVTVWQLLKFCSCWFSYWRLTAWGRKRQLMIGHALDLSPAPTGAAGREKLA